MRHFNGLRKFGGQVMKIKRVKYAELSAKQKEIYNFQKLSGVLADYRFNCIKLHDDWLGADFLAYHKDENNTLRVQLKSRLCIYKKYSGKNLHIAFPYRNVWYLIPHDRLVEIVGEVTSWLHTNSWVEKGGYSSATLPKNLLENLSEYTLN